MNTGKGNEIVTTITFIDAKTPPPVLTGEMAYFLVATKVGNKIYSACYLNNYEVYYEDGCPDDNGVGGCARCENGDGHLATGWFREEGYEDNLKFVEQGNADIKVLAWAHPPVFEGFEK